MKWVEVRLLKVSTWANTKTIHQGLVLGQLTALSEPEYKDSHVVVERSQLTATALKKTTPDCR
jgi:hypothetical protein